MKVRSEGTVCEGVAGWGTGRQSNLPNTIYAHAKTAIELGAEEARMIGLCM